MLRAECVQFKSLEDLNWTQKEIMFALDHSDEKSRYRTRQNTHQRFTFSNTQTNELFTLILQNMFTYACKCKEFSLLFNCVYSI